MPQAHGDIAQLIERSIRIAEVEGLSPSISTNLWLKCSRDLEARQLQPDKYAARKWAILGIISRISIGDVIRYDLTLQRGGNHKDLRPLQDNERICRADGTSIVDMITRGWSCDKSSPVVYACIARTNTDCTDYRQTAE